MYGLKMKKNYLLEILYGKKSCDARIQDTSIRGKIGLIDTDTYELLGYADLLGTEKTDYEAFVNWHICPEYDSLKAKTYIDNLDFVKLKSPAYFYKFGEVEELEIPLIVNPKDETSVWVEFDPEELQTGYKQISLFDF